LKFLPGRKAFFEKQSLPLDAADSPLPGYIQMKKIGELA
jgi:hypothetical protein